MAAPNPYDGVPEEAFYRTIDAIFTQPSYSQQQRDEISRIRVQFKDDYPKRGSSAKEAALQALFSVTRDQQYVTDTLIKSAQSVPKVAPPRGTSPGLYPVQAGQPVARPAAPPPQPKNDLYKNNPAFLQKLQQLQGSMQLPPGLRPQPGVNPMHDMKRTAELAQANKAKKPRPDGPLGANPLASYANNPAMQQMLMSMSGTLAAARPTAGQQQQQQQQQARAAAGAGIASQAPAAKSAAAPAAAARGGAAGKGADAADDITKADDISDILHGVFDAEAEQAALLNPLQRAAQAAVKPKLQEEYVLNEEPLLRKAVEAAKKHGLSVTRDCFQYLALAVEAHMVGLLQVMAKTASQRSDPAKDLPGMVKVGPNIRQGIGQIARGDKLVREARLKEEQEKLLQQAQSKSRKIDSEQKAQIQQAKEQKQKTQQLEGARSVLGGAFAFRKKGGLFGQGGMASKARASKSDKGKGGDGAGDAAGDAPATAAGGKGSGNGGKGAQAAATPFTGGEQAADASANGGPTPMEVDDIKPPAASGRLGSASSLAPAPSTSLRPSGSMLPGPGGGRGGPVALSTRDLAAAMERDQLLCRHGLLYRIHNEVMCYQDGPPPAPPPP